jgi:hypothetical protein
MAYVTIRFNFDEEIYDEVSSYFTYTEGNFTVLENTIPSEERLGLQEELNQNDNAQIAYLNDAIEAVNVPGLN